MRWPSSIATDSTKPSLVRVLTLAMLACPLPAAAQWLWALRAPRDWAEVERELTALRAQYNVLTRDVLVVSAERDGLSAAAVKRERDYEELRAQYARELKYCASSWHADRHCSIELRKHVLPMLLSPHTPGRSRLLRLPPPPPP
jgi:hypothetical protein